MALAHNANASGFSVERTRSDGVDVVILKDAGRQMEVDVAVSIGNMAYQMRVKGQPVFWPPTTDLAAWKAKPSMHGIPFLAPWANRMQGYTYFVGDKEFHFDRELGNVHPDNHGNPIHGLLTTDSRWRVVRAEAGDDYAEVTSQFDFWKFPELMAQFPFAHTIDMTYRLSDGELQVETVLRNRSEEPMPVAIGFHPWLTITDAPRDEWQVSLAAREQMLLTPELLPTGETRPTPYPEPFTLAKLALDDDFTNLVRNAKGLAEFSVKGKNQKVTVAYGPRFPVAVVYAQPRGQFICFEPMSAPTNALGLAHEGKYSELQFVEPGGAWKGTFWIRPEGY